jgi:hypothetical protein
VSGDAVDVVARLKEESEVPLRSHGSLSLNRALLAAGLVDRVQVTLFPVICGQTGVSQRSTITISFSPRAQMWATRRGCSRGTACCSSRS